MSEVVVLWSDRSGWSDNGSPGVATGESPEPGTGPCLRHRTYIGRGKERRNWETGVDNQEIKEDAWSEVPALLTSLYRVVNRLEELFPGRKFTPDGHLVGSIGEAMAARMFDLTLLQASTAKHDATSADGESLVQIKLTQGNRGIALRAEPEHLLVLRLARDLSVEVVYNGCGHAPWAAAGKMNRNGQRAISLSRLRDLDGKVHDSVRLPLCNALDLRC